jgi:hypothetical protein
MAWTVFTLFCTVTAVATLSVGVVANHQATRWLDGVIAICGAGAAGYGLSQAVTIRKTLEQHRQRLNRG